MSSGFVDSPISSQLCRLPLPPSSPPSPDSKMLLVPLLASLATLVSGAPVRFAANATTAALTAVDVAYARLGLELGG